MLKDDFILEFDAFLRSFGQNVNQQHSFLLGAGCSISSGVPSAYTCIWDWKRQIYQTNNPRIPHISIESDNDKREIQRWCDLQPGFPSLNSDEEYTFYAEKAFPDEIDRVAYFENLFKGKQPSIGYNLLAFLAKNNVVQSVWTTNFDGFTEDASKKMGVTVYPISIDNEQNIYRNLSRAGLKYIAIHGDYKYSKLKNTEKELYNQESAFVEAMKSHLAEKHLIVIGYSGRDKSLMNALNIAYSHNGGGRLFWLGMESEPTSTVKELLIRAKKSGRSAYYIQAKGFDETLLQMVNVTFGRSILFQTFAQEYLSVQPKKTITPFKVQRNGQIIKYASTNLLPVTLPKHCYVFSIKKSLDFTTREIINANTNGCMIITSLFKGKVYAIGAMSDIYTRLGNFIEDKPTLVELTEESYTQFPCLKKLMLKAITLGIARKTGLQMSFNGQLWQKDTLYCGKNGIHECVKLNLLLNPHKSFMYISITPSLHFDQDIAIDRLTKQDMCRNYLDGLRNKAYYEKILTWINKIFAGKYLKIAYSETSNEFVFNLSSNTACCQIYGNGNDAYTANGFDLRRIQYSASKIPEPLLTYSTTENKYVHDINPMRGLNSNMPFDLPTFALKPSNISLGVICPKSWASTLYTFLNKLNIGNIKPRYPDYLQMYPGFSTAYKTSLDIPYYQVTNMWINCKDTQNDGYELAKNICSAIDKLSEMDPKAVIVVFIPSIWSKIRDFNVQGINFDFHDYIKAHCAQQRITTQFIEEKTITNQLMECEIMWWISLAIFVKSGRTPWTLGSLNQNTAYAGIGYSINKQGVNDNRKVVVGCSHIYNAQGQGLKFRLKKIDNPIIDRKNNPYLTKDEAYKLGLSIVELFRDSMYKAPNRVVIHKRTIFKQDEIDGLVTALSPHVQDIELITIEEEKDYKLIPGSLGQAIYPASYPIERGACLVIGDNKALLWTHGVVDSVIPGKSFYQGGKGIPMPLRLTRCYGDSSLEEIASEILSFTKINWNSFYFYSKMPATIDTSNVVAKIGGLLQHYNGNTFDYKYFI